MEIFESGATIVMVTLVGSEFVLPHCSKILNLSQCYYALTNANLRAK